MIITILKFLALYLAICGFSTLFFKEIDVSKAKLFFISVILTPIGEALYVLYLRRKSDLKHYHHRCPRCKYYFTESLDSCPICAKEGVDLKLTRFEIYYGVKS